MENKIARQLNEITHSAVQIDMNSPEPAQKPATTQETIADEQLWVSEAKAGSQVAFEKLYRNHSQRIYSLCWRLSGGQSALAEELTQEAFIRAWSKLESFRGDSRFGTWLHRVAANVALSDRRIRLRKVNIEHPIADGLLEVSADVERDRGLIKDLELGISRLPERARAVLVLHDVEGYRHRDIADELGMAVGTSKAQLHRARRILREYLEHET